MTKFAVKHHSIAISLRVHLAILIPRYNRQVTCSSLTKQAANEIQQKKGILSCLECAMHFLAPSDVSRPLSLPIWNTVI